MLAKQEQARAYSLSPLLSEVELSDGARTIVAMEKQRVPDLPDELLPYGCKVLLGGDPVVETSPATHFIWSSLKAEAPLQYI